MTTPILDLADLSNSAGNYLLANQNWRALENAYGDFLSVSLASGNATLTNAQFRAAALFRATGNTVARDLTVPAIKRLFVVENTGTAALNVKRGTTTIVVQPGSATLLYADGTTNGLSAIAGGSGAGSYTTTVASSGGVLNLSAVITDTVLVTLTENITSITLPAGASGIRKDLIIRFVQDGTGGRTVSLSAFTWEGGTPPSIASGAGAVSYITACNCSNLGWDGFK